MKLVKILCSALLAVSSVACTQEKTEGPVRVKMTVDENPIVPYLAESLGYLKEEGVEIVPVKVEDFAPNDFQFQKPLIDGDIDMAYHWFSHAIFGARHDLPLVAVMVINDAPAMEVLVSNERRDTIHSAADFIGINVAEGATYGTKSVLTGYLAKKAGLPPQSYVSVIKEVAGRQQAVIEGLKAQKVDVVTAQQPMIAALKRENLASTLYDLSSGESTRAVLGDVWPAQSLLTSPGFAKANPRAVQGVVNAYVKVLRYMSRHSVEEIVGKLPTAYFEGKDREAEIELIRNTQASYATENFGFDPASVALVNQVLKSSAFDDSASGRWRSESADKQISLDTLYDNRFVDKAMREFP